jgi:hypothetical protein
MRKLFCLFALLPVAALADNWIESSSGDLSGAGLAPSQLTGSAGSNLVRGSFGNGDLDYLAFLVPEGFTLNAIITGSGNNTGLSRSFIGVQLGPVMTVPPGTSNAAGLLGWTHFGVADGINLLPEMSLARLGSAGFTAPLAAGVYTFWLNETSNEPGLTFDLDFQLEPVPLPPALGLLTGGAALLGALRRRRSRLPP